MASPLDGRQEPHAPVERGAGIGDHGAHMLLRGGQRARRGDAADRRRIAAHRAARPDAGAGAGGCRCGRRGASAMPMPRRPHSRNCGLSSSTRPASGSRRRSSAESRRAIATITPDSRRKPAARQHTRQLAGPHEQLVGAIERAIQHLAHGRRRGGPVELLDADAGRGEAVLRQVDPVQRAIVVLAVLQVVQDLQGVAQRVGIRVQLGPLAMQVEQEAADRRGRQRAIAEEILPVVVAKLDGVAPEGGEQVERMLRRHAGRRQAGAQGLRLGQPGGGLGRPRQGAREGIEPRDLVVGRQRRVVADIVGGAHEGVEGRDMRAQRRGQQPRADLKVLVPGALARGRLNRAVQCAPPAIVSPSRQPSRSAGAALPP